MLRTQVQELAIDVLIIQQKQERFFEHAVLVGGTAASFVIAGGLVYGNKNI
jgi:hypothetical protein